MLKWAVGYASYNVCEPVVDAVRRGAETVLDLSDQLAGVVLDMSPVELEKPGEVRTGLGFVIASNVLADGSNFHLGSSWRWNLQENVETYLLNRLGENGLGYRGELRELALRYSASRLETEHLGAEIENVLRSVPVLLTTEFSQLSSDSTLWLGTDATWDYWREVVVERIPAALPLFVWANGVERKLGDAKWDNDWGTRSELALRRVFGNWFLETARWLFFYQHEVGSRILEIDFEAPKLEGRALSEFAGLGKRLSADVALGILGNRDGGASVSGMSEKLEAYGMSRASILEQYHKRNAELWRRRIAVARKAAERVDYYRVNRPELKIESRRVGDLIAQMIKAARAGRSEEVVRIKPILAVLQEESAKT